MLVFLCGYILKYYLSQPKFVTKKMSTRQVVTRKMSRRHKVVTKITRQTRQKAVTRGENIIKCLLEELC